MWTHLINWSSQFQLVLLYFYLFLKLLKYYSDYGNRTRCGRCKWQSSDCAIGNDSNYHYNWFVDCVFFLLNSVTFSSGCRNDDDIWNDGRGSTCCRVPRWIRWYCWNWLFLKLFYLKDIRNNIWLIWFELIDLIWFYNLIDLIFLSFYLIDLIWIFYLIYFVWFFYFIDFIDLILLILLIWFDWFDWF